MTVGSTSTDIDLGVMETPSPSNSSKAITNEIKMTDLAQSIQQITLDLTYIKSRFEVHFNSKPKYPKCDGCFDRSFCRFFSLFMAPIFIFLHFFLVYVFDKK